MGKNIRILGLAVLLVLCSCTENDHAKRVLEENGYKNIRLTGYEFFACSGDDFYHTGFVADSPIGRPVVGTVCSGLILKNSTIRFR